ncbi:MAG: D-alanyl-D-alanine carboxypeptidase/D-alanyl-D-alanine-endopeptidase [Deltaproteobacteria bacterium]|nr:D-alanyl-D-alanine carboxypeptidase/D-alanyl-D-alanine-endopeptidase [Deltaproteobacteria bacterium]
MKIFIIVFATFFCLSNIAFSEEELSTKIDEILSHPLIKPVDLTVYAYNISKSKEIYQREKNKQLNPASITKLLTSAAALYYLGAYYKFPTEVYLQEFPDDGGIVEGDLYIKGYGDPRMVNENIFNLVLELKREGINQINGNIYLDSSFFDRDYFRPGWQKDIGIRAYYAPVSATAVNFNSFTVYVKPASKEGKKPIVFTEPPLPKYFKIINNALTTLKGNTIEVDVKPKKGYLEVIVSGDIGINQRGKKFNRRVEDPDSYAVEVFRWFFNIHGIKVKGRFGIKEVPKDDYKLFYTYYSEPLMSVLKDLNKHSNNFSADQLLKHMGGQIYGAPATFEKGLRVIASFMEIAGISKSEYYITNGSGLSHENRMSSETVVKLLNYVYNNFQLMPEYLASLSIAAGDGTIRKRFFNTPCELKTRVKTGSIDGVASIAGFTINSKLEVISFSLIANGFNPKNYREISEILDSVVVELSK